MRAKQKITLEHIKYKQKQAFPYELEGILISDERLKASFEDPVIQPAIYEGLDLSHQEQEALKLPPKFTMYESLSREKMANSSEVLVDKLRWEERARQQREGAPWSTEWEWDKVKKATVFDEPNKTMDHARERVTDMPFCRRKVKSGDFLIQMTDKTANSVPIPERTMLQVYNPT